MIRSKNPGRLTGLLYLLVSLPGAFALVYVPSQWLVQGDPAATIGNIMSSEPLFRLGIGAALVSQALFIVVAFALYDLFKGVNQRLAALMVTFIAAGIPIAFLNELNSVATLHLVHGGDLLAALEKPQRDALAMLFVELHKHGIEVAAIFWALWLFPMGLLVYRSGFVPRLLGILLILNCFAYLANSLASLSLPQYAATVTRWTMPLHFGEVAFIFWLLIAGARPAPPAPSLPAEAAR